MAKVLVPASLQRCDSWFEECPWILDNVRSALPLQGAVFNEMRSKTKVLQKPVSSNNPKDFPDWSFDGSSTGQAEGNNSDCILK